MSLSVATWNINSVRLRINNVKRYLRLRKPDVLCLQETKCPDEFFPHKAFEGLGYTHRLVQGMKSYNGVAILSKVPFTANNIHHRCGKEDCRHIEVALDTGGDPILLDNLYIPAGGDIPDPDAQRQVRAQARFLPRDGPVVRRPQAAGVGAQGTAPHRRRRSQRGAAGARRVEPQAAPQDRVAHAGRGRAVRPPEGVARLDRRAAPLRARRTRSSIRGGATATTTGAPPTAAGGSTISWPRRPCRAPSAVIASTSTRATGSRRPTTCR